MNVTPDIKITKGGLSEAREPGVGFVMRNELQNQVQSFVSRIKPGSKREKLMNTII